ncbi:MAG: hypothetical protein KDH19_10930 [Geminicoccaceae bacterium]|nr:hypothetical protein [Geminicoccaceae bacterium]
MFRISEEQTYWWPVTVNFPADGAFAKMTFKGQFKVIPVSDLQRIAGGSSLEIIREALIGWKDIVDESGEQVPFSEAAREQLLESPFAIAALSRALTASVEGRREKN